MLGQLQSGQRALQLSWPKDVRCGCSSLLILSLDVSSGLMVPTNPWGRYKTAFFSAVCLLESLSGVILPWRFHAGPVQGVHQMRVWKWARYKTVCFTLLLSVLWVWSHGCCQRFSFGNLLQQLFSSNSLLSLTFMDFFFSLESCYSISDFCSPCKLERRGQMMPVLANTTGMTALLVQTLPWQRGTESCIYVCICHACVWCMMDLLVSTRLLIPETICQKTWCRFQLEHVQLLQTLLRAGTKKTQVFLVQFEREIIVVSQIPLWSGGCL